MIIDCLDAIDNSPKVWAKHDLVGEWFVLSMFVHAEDPEMVSLATLTAGLDDEKKEPKARHSSISSYTG